MKEVTTKAMEGISDLVILAPIKEDFIKAFETITYASRLEIVANALNRLRVAAREYERLTPYSDVTERILSLLDFRVGVVDEELFSLARGPKGARTLTPRRYLYLTATFEGGFEPYMRQIWRPLGPFLDLLFCNCDDYITATDHSFDEYIQWVRDNQLDSAIFYNTTGITVRDQKYLSSFEKAQRAGGASLADGDLILAKHTMAYPDDEAAKVRGTPAYFVKTAKLGFEALNVLYKLTDYYPPEWLTGPAGEPGESGEGHRLVRATRDLLLGWDEVLKEVKARAPNTPAFARALETYAEPLNWYETGCKHIAAPEVKADPEFCHGQVQSGILKPHGSRERPVSCGAMMLFTIREAGKAKGFIQALLKEGVIGFGDAPAPADDSTVFANIAFTSQGLLELGMLYTEHDWLPKEFRDGLAQRSSQVGDLRENHPRNWILPERNGPDFVRGEVALADDVHEGMARAPLPPVTLDEVDFALQLRGFDEDAVRQLAHRLATRAAPGATLEAIDWLNVRLDGDRFRDHFDFVDGVSQPKPKVPGKPDGGLERDKVALGEVVLGYANDRGDGPPDVFRKLDRSKPGEVDTAWRKPPRQKALDLLKNGSFLVVRKIGEDVAGLDAWLDAQQGAVATQLGCSVADARAHLRAAMIGRNADGTPLVPSQTSTNDNDFDYGQDREGLACPHVAHIRRANPRRWDPRINAPTAARREFDRPTPRLLRRGMLFGKADDDSRGIMFMAYAASIAEQYEVIQRWLNGGNPTDVASANNDPLTGVSPKGGPNTLRFVARGANGQRVVVRAQLPSSIGDETEPGRHPFTPLHWGLYLFAPSLAALETISGETDDAGDPDQKDDADGVRHPRPWEGGYRPLREMLELAIGQAQIDTLESLPRPQAAKEWKRLIEDFVTKDPSERDISPHLSSAIRYNHGGVFDLRMPLAPPLMTPAQSAAWKSFWGRSPEELVDAEAGDDAALRYNWNDPNLEKQNFILCAGEGQILQVLKEWQNFTSQEQLRRIVDKTGPIYVTQQPDDEYIDDNSGAFKGLSYHAESQATNAILFEYDEEAAFRDGYNAGVAVLSAMKTPVGGSTSREFKIELRRQYIQPAIGMLWKAWYGLPDEDVLCLGGWTWKQLVDIVTDKDTQRSHALCPGDFMAPSRGAVYPRPNASIRHYAKAHGDALHKAGLAFVDKMRRNPSLPRPPLVRALFEAYPAADQREVLARNIIGTMIGAIPPMDANLRNIILEWMLEKRLWRHQAAFKAVLAGDTVLNKASAVRDVLSRPIAQAMCKRPAPDLLFRTAKGEAKIKKSRGGSVDTKEGDLVVLNLASASQWRLDRNPEGRPEDVSIIFGGVRKKPLQGYDYKDGVVTPRNDGAVHACPAQKMAMGAMTGILAALLDAGTIQALPAPLIVRISDW